MALAFGSILLAGSCKEDDKGSAPTTSPQMVKAESVYFIEEVNNKATYSADVKDKPVRKEGDETVFGGRVRIKWNRPVGVDYHHLNIRYTIKGKNYLHQASAWADEAIIGDLLAKYGKITFKITPCSKTGVEGKTITTVAQASPVEKQNRVKKEALPLGEKDLWTNNQEKTEGPMGDLLDDDAGTFFHMDWHNQTEFPHWMVFKLPAPRKSFKFFYENRKGHANQHIKKMQIFASNKFDYCKFDEPFTYEVGVKTKKDFDKDHFNPVTDPKVKGFEVAMLDKNLLAGDGEYISDQFTLKEPAQYVIVKIIEGANSKFISLGTWKFFDEKVAVFDPENGIDETN